MHWGAALAGSITDLSSDSLTFFSVSHSGSEMNLRLVRCIPFFFFPHDYYLVCFTCV